MEKATISELENGLVAYLEKVRAGQTVIVFDCGIPIARLERIEPDEVTDDAASRLERFGLVRRSRSQVPIALLKCSPPKAERSVTRALIDERKDGR